MFQVSNPLRFYSNNPNIDDTNDTDGTYTAVPSLADSQQRLKRVNKITNYIIYGCAIFLLSILLLTIGITIWKSISERTVVVESTDSTDLGIPDDKILIEEPEPIYVPPVPVPEPEETKDPNLCDECLDYNEIIRISKISSKNAETYIVNKVAESTTLDLDSKDDERIAAMETFVDRISVIPRALEKVNRFLFLNQSFNLDVSQAAEKEQGTQDIRLKYEQKVQEIGDHTVKALTNIGETGDLRKQKEKLDKELRDTEAALAKKINDLEDQKYEIELQISKFREDLARLLAEHDIPSESDLNGRLSSRRDLIQVKQKETAYCERKIDTNSREVNKLTIEIRRLTDLLENTKLQLTQYQWVSHILQTIAKFEDVRTQVKELQVSQLADGKDSLNKLINSLTNKEDSYVDAVQNLNTPDARTESSTVDQYGNVKRIITLTTVRDTDVVANLKVYIQREQELLRTWAREQFKTLKLSVNEIRNLTSTIDNLRDRIRDHSAEYEKQSRLVSSIQSNITAASNAMLALNQDIGACKDTIITAKSEIAGAQADLTRLGDLLAKLKAASGETAKKEARLLALKSEIDKENQYLDALRKSLRDRIKKIDETLAELDEKLKGITAELNGAITADPQARDVEKYIAGYLTQIKKSNNEYKDLLGLLEDINRIIC